MNATAHHARNASRADLKRIGVDPEFREKLKAERDQAVKEACSRLTIGCAKSMRSELLGGLEPRHGGILRRVNPSQPPAKPPITTVAFADDGNGKRLRITMTIEELP